MVRKPLPEAEASEGEDSGPGDPFDGGFVTTVGGGHDPGDALLLTLVTLGSVAVLWFTSDLDPRIMLVVVVPVLLALGIRALQRARAGRTLGKVEVARHGFVAERGRPSGWESAWHHPGTSRWSASGPSSWAGR